MCVRFNNLLKLKILGKKKKKMQLNGTSSYNEKKKQKQNLTVKTVIF